MTVEWLRRLTVFVALAATASLGAAQAPPSPAAVAKAVREYRLAHEQPIIQELVDLLAIPNIASDEANIRRNADLLKVMFERRGFRVQFHEISKRGPSVFADLPAPGAARTVVFYAHYDGQPVDPKAWTGTAPFEPGLRTGSIEAGGTLRPFPAAGIRYEDDWRIYARSASDDRSPIVAMLAAVDALAASGIPRAVNLKVVLDSEEENGSPGLGPALAAHRDFVRGDVLITGDGPVHQSGRPLVFYGNRGVLDLNLTVYGPARGLHSGHYGNWAPNPAMRLAQLLSTFKDDNGRVVVEGFYDGIEPLRGEEQEMLDAVPDNPEQLKALFGISTAEDPQRSLQQGLQIPSFNVRGLSSAFVGADARTIVPDRAVAAIDIRLVRETPADQMVEKVRAHLRKQGYHVVAVDPDDATRARYSKIVKMDVRGDGTNAYRTSPLHPVSQQLSAAMTRVFGEPPVRIRTSGGTVPIAPFIEALGFPAISVPTVNFDNNQHGENENLRLGHFLRGITIIAAALTM